MMVVMMKMKMAQDDGNHGVLRDVKGMGIDRCEYRPSLGKWQSVVIRENSASSSLYISLPNIWLVSMPSV